MIERFITLKQLIKDPTVMGLAEPYLKKARSNLVTMEILSKAKDHKDILAIPKDHSDDEWVVVVAYYAMYMSALSLVAKVGYRSKSHTATSVALEEFFVKNNLLEKSHFDNFESVRMRKEEIETLRDVRDRREIAQYSVTKRTTKDIAEKTKSDARRFVDRVEEIFEKIRSESIILDMDPKKDSDKRAKDLESIKKFKSSSTRTEEDALKMGRELNDRMSKRLLGKKDDKE